MKFNTLLFLFSILFVLNGVFQASADIVVESEFSTGSGNTRVPNPFAPYSVRNFSVNAGEKLVVAVANENGATAEDSLTFETETSVTTLRQISAGGAGGENTAIYFADGLSGRGDIVFSPGAGSRSNGPGIYVASLSGARLGFETGGHFSVDSGVGTTLNGIGDGSFVVAIFADQGPSDGSNSDISVAGDLIELASPFNNADGGLNPNQGNDIGLAVATVATGFGNGNDLEVIFTTPTQNRDNFAFASFAVAVPEPTSLVVLILLLLVFATRRYRGKCANLFTQSTINPPRSSELASLVKPFVIFLVTVFSTLGAHPAHAFDILYSVNANSGELSTIDLTDGNRTQIANVGRTGIGTLTYDGSRDTLFTISSSELLKIDRRNGSVETAGPILSGGIRGLAYDSQLDRLLGLNLTGQLVVIDPGNASLETVGELGASIADIAFDETTNTLFGVANTTNSLYTIDRATGLATVVGAIGFEGVLGVAAQPGTGDLYATDVGSVGAFTQLLFIDKATGAGTAIGPRRSSFVAATAFAPSPVAVPEPNLNFVMIMLVTRLLLCRKRSAFN